MSTIISDEKDSGGKTMRPADMIQMLRCPSCGGELDSGDGDAVACAACEKEYPMEGNVLRFVPAEGYASSFGYQWKKFSKVQLDSCNGTDFSESRFQSITGWGPETLGGARVLDVGCGAGRFTEIALKFGAKVVSADLSDAVEACRDNNPSEDLLVCQASIYELPFAEGAFDFAFCIGVIQHTPDPHESIRNIARMVKPGGQMALWIYERDWKAYVGTVAFKYIFRPYTMNLSMEEQIEFSRRIVDRFLAIARWSRDRGVLGKIIMRLLPVSSAHLQGIPLSDEDFKQWVYLDTFDMYSPAHDHPQKYGTIARLLAELGFTDIRRMPHGGISIVGTRKGE